jgi:hypothetical protein
MGLGQEWLVKNLYSGSQKQSGIVKGDSSIGSPASRGTTVPVGYSQLNQHVAPGRDVGPTDFLEYRNWKPSKLSRTTVSVG